MADKETLDIDGVCPNIQHEGKVSPILDEEEETYICAQCEFRLGDTSEDARKKFEFHARDIER